MLSASASLVDKSASKVRVVRRIAVEREYLAGPRVERDD